MTGHDTTRGTQGEGRVRTLADAIAERVEIAGKAQWHDYTDSIATAEEVTLMLAVIGCCDRRRQAQRIVNRSLNYDVGHGDAPDLWKAVGQATDDMNAALDALHRHWIGDTDGD